LDLVHPLAEAYATRFTTPEDAVLAGIAERAQLEHPQPHMLSGAVQGKFLEIVVQLMRPQRILEVGTMHGYSTLCLAKGLAPDGRLHTIELREADAAIAAGNFAAAGFAHCIVQHTGDAVQIIPTLHETWDLVFLDADKVHYEIYYELVKPRLRKGGLLIADNVLFHGHVLQPELKGKNARAIHAFNQRVAADPDVECVMLTVRDGLMLIRKK